MSTGKKEKTERGDTTRIELVKGEKRVSVKPMHAGAYLAKGFVAVTDQVITDEKQGGE